MNRVFNQQGQSVVEYVLLLAVVMFLISTVFRSPLVADLLGEDSSFFNALKVRMEYSYRFTHEGHEAGVSWSTFPPDQHDSYKKDGGSRFAGATTVYGP